MIIRFAWDAGKEKENIKKHRVSFDEAKTIFFNFPLEIYFDPEHSGAEDRYLAFGFSNRDRILLVVHMENIKGTEIRLISARKATTKEAHQVFGGMNP